jgi:hypothetical protein
MTQLLKFLVRYCQPLFEEHGFEITDSKNAADEKQIHLRNSQLALLLKQKDQELPEILFQSLYEKTHRSWHRLDQISTLLRRPTTEHRLNDANTAFLLTHLNLIVQLFSREETTKTLARLRTLKPDLP